MSKGTIWEKNFPWKKHVLFHSISEKHSKKFSLVAQFFQWDFKENMLPIQKRHFGQIFHGNVFASYRHWAGETFFDLWQKNFLQVCNKCTLFVHIAIWMVLSSLGKRPLFLNQFRTSISEFVSGLLPKSFQLDFSELRSSYTEEHL